jgi:hypothetical protein
MIADVHLLTPVEVFDKWVWLQRCTRASLHRWHDQSRINPTGCPCATAFSGGPFIFSDPPLHPLPGCHSPPITPPSCVAITAKAA